MLGAILGAFQTLGFREDDDSIDRLHYFITSNSLIAMSILVSFKQFGGKPIECMCPKRFSGGWEQYTENFCWAQDTYFLPMDEGVPVDEEYRYRSKISYYQWVPFFLLVQAACFRLPSLLWKYMAGHSGISIHDIVKLGTDPKNVEMGAREHNISSLTVHLQNALRFHRRLFKKKIMPHKFFRPLNLPYNAFFVTLVYLLTKCAYLVNVFVQLWLMNWFLGTTDADPNKETDNTSIYSGLYGFQECSLAQHYVRVMGNVQEYSVQCVLVINIFNEKIFVFLWFWYIILIIFTGISFVYWVIVMCIPMFSRHFVSRHLELSEMPFDPDASKRDIQRFVGSYLRTDGVFVLRMITMHAGIIFGTDLILSLWKAFYGIEESYKRQASLPTPALNPIPPPLYEAKTKQSIFQYFAKKKDKLNDDEKRDLMAMLLPSGKTSRTVVADTNSHVRRRRHHRRRNDSSELSSEDSQATQKTERGKKQGQPKRPNAPARDQSTDADKYRTQQRRKNEVRGLRRLRHDHNSNDVDDDDNRRGRNKSDSENDRNKTMDPNAMAMAGLIASAPSETIDSSIINMQTTEITGNEEV